MTTMPSKPGVTRKCHCFEPTHPHGVSRPLSAAVGLNASAKLLQESLMHAEQKGPPHWNSAGAILYHFCLFIVFIDAALRDVTTIQTSSHFLFYGQSEKAAHWWASDWPEYSVGAAIGHPSLFFRAIGRIRGSMGQYVSRQELHRGLWNWRLMRKNKEQVCDWLWTTWPPDCGRLLRNTKY